MTTTPVLGPPAGAEQPRPLGGDAETFRQELFDAGVLRPTGVDGVYGRSHSYEQVANALIDAIRTMAAGQFEEVCFPPLLARATFDRTDYLRSFPDLMGSVHVFRGDDRSHAELLRRYPADSDWSALLEPAEVTLCSAACHALYPMCSGRLEEGGRRLATWSWCFRHEPSPDPCRMTAFRMYELVYVGEAGFALAHREAQLADGLNMLSSLGLDLDIVVANDPFFGRIGSMLAAAQVEDALKLEGVTPIVSTQRPTAIISGNCAGTHFGEPFGIMTADGDVAHSACVAFGIDRIVLALLRRHGLDPARWPSAVRDHLWS